MTGKGFNSELWRIIKENRRWLAAGLILFAASALLGAYIGTAYRAYAEKYFANLGKTFSPFVDVFKQRNYILLFIMIFIKNLLAMAVSFFLGWLFFPLGGYSLFQNGFALGLVISYIGHGENIFRVALSILPHGIIEIPVIVMACSFGMELGILWYRCIGQPEHKADYRRIKNDMVKIFPFLIFLLAVAAFIESHITPKLAGL